MFCIGSSSSSSSSVQAENCSAHFVQNKGGANNICLQKSGMPLAGLVYLYLNNLDSKPGGLLSK